MPFHWPRDVQTDRQSDNGEEILICCHCIVAGNTKIQHDIKNYRDLVWCWYLKYFPFFFQVSLNMGLNPEQMDGQHHFNIDPFPILQMGIIIQSTYSVHQHDPFQLWEIYKNLISLQLYFYINNLLAKIKLMRGLLHFYFSFI